MKTVKTRIGQALGVLALHYLSKILRGIVLIPDILKVMEETAVMSGDSHYGDVLLNPP